LTTSKHKVNLT